MLDNEWEGVGTFTLERAIAKLPEDSFPSIKALELALGRINADLEGTNQQMEARRLSKIREERQCLYGQSTGKKVRVGDKRYEIISVPGKNPSGFVLRIFGPLEED